MNMFNQRRAFICIACVTVASMTGVLSWSSRAFAREEAPKAPTVRLVIDFGEGFEKHFNKLPWIEGMTVKSAMEAAKALPPPREMTFESKGEGERGMVVTIDGLANEGAGKSTRNWLFWVNDAPGEKSYAIMPMNPGDVATWRFATYDTLGQKPK